VPAITDAYAEIQVETENKTGDLLGDIEESVFFCLFVCGGWEVGEE